MASFKSILVRLPKLLSIRGLLYYLCTRLGTPRVRAWVWDQRYPKTCLEPIPEKRTRESPTLKIVEKYARKGRILDLGCGTGSLGTKLDPDSFESYLGIEVSPAAISIAQKRKTQKINFEIGDLQHYKCKEKYDLIVFEESLYYVPFFRQRLLRRYACCLHPRGLFVVTVAHPNEFRGMIRMIRKNFHIIEERFTSPSGGRLLLVFN